MIARIMSITTHAPMKICQPYIVLWKWTSADIDRSQESATQPNPKRITSATAIFPWSECCVWSSRRSSPNPARIRSRSPLAHASPLSGRMATSSRTEFQTNQQDSAVRRP